MKTNFEKSDSKIKLFGVAEWCPYSVNIVKGCVNGCFYCFSSANLIKFGMKTKETWAIEEIRFKEVNKTRVKLDGSVMFPSTHDITPTNLEYCLVTLKKLLSAGNKVLIVSKPTLKVVKTLCKELAPYKKQILFRFTIGTYKQNVLSFWEPNAPTFVQRFNSLKYAFEHGFKTSVSCEPCLSPDVRPLIEKLLPYVTDAIWIGKPNLFIQRLSINGHKDADTIAKARKLLSELSDEWAFDLFKDYKRNRKIKWKESLKKVLGIAAPKQEGLDV